VRLIWKQPNLFAATLLQYKLPLSRKELVAWLKTRK
jgi:hypothetical protein